MEDLQAADPRTIGPYRTLSRIGTGGMGVVFLVEDLSGGRFALKLLRPELADDAGFRSRFRREVEAAQRVGGVCNARYLDADLGSEHPYLVTEYVEGGNLLDFVAEHGPIVGDQLIGLAVGLAEALVAMDAAGVIHRDLKPSNVLMAPSGPKVVDFGVAHAADGTALTQTGFVVGSPGWMAPEQAIGSGTTPAIDIFSWGATVAFAATGRPPFGEGRPDAVLYRVVHEAPDTEGIDPRLVALVIRTLQKEPALRPTADQLLIELVRTAMAGSMPPGGSTAMTTAVLDRTWHQSPLEPPAEEPARRSRAWLFAFVGLVFVALLIGGGIALAAHKSGQTSAPGPSAHGTSTSSSPTSSTTSPPPVRSTSNPAGKSGSQSPSALVSATLPVVACPTSYGVSPSPAAASLPSVATESVPSDLASQLTVFADEQGGMELLAPTGWVCSADYGADGSGGVSAYPNGETLQSGVLASGSTVEAIQGSQTSACTSCREVQACPLFATAANDYQLDYQMPCPSSLPSGESTAPIQDGVVGFQDPPGTAGTGASSGGAYPANGVMTYHSGNEPRISGARNPQRLATSRRSP